MARTPCPVSRGATPLVTSNITSRGSLLWVRARPPRERLRAARASLARGHLEQPGQVFRLWARSGRPSRQPIAGLAVASVTGRWAPRPRTAHSRLRLLASRPSRRRVRGGIGVDSRSTGPSCRPRTSLPFSRPASYGRQSHLGHRSPGTVTSWADTRNNRENGTKQPRVAVENRAGDRSKRSRCSAA